MGVHSTLNLIDTDEMILGHSDEPKIWKRDSRSAISLIFMQLERLFGTDVKSLPSWSSGPRERAD